MNRASMVIYNDQDVLDRYTDEFEHLAVLQARCDENTSDYTLVIKLREYREALDAKIKEDEFCKDLKTNYEKSDEGRPEYPLKAVRSFLRNIDTLRKFHNWLVREKNKVRFKEVVITGLGVEEYRQLLKDIDHESYDKKQSYYFFFNYFLREREKTLF
ncbi:hypothetical protein [Enterococcus casseliflavus]|uniref:hypothetical protein n=1 Tax=Enterococcus casseliflavus TaxID=37734 RepID=UPI0029537858|nr:hypothetical protein [Enterococcus casseliflavus]MDV7751188.1 hypothetical protein [Enterococcus casseliflavus]